MKFVEKCPKCGGNVQTKSVKKSLGLGFVEIPVAQFCLNPTCDWYQDFSEAKKPDEIQENVLQIKIPSLKNKAKGENKAPEPNKAPGANKAPEAIKVPKANKAPEAIKVPKPNKAPEAKKPQLHIPEAISKVLSQKETRRSVITLAGVIVFSAILIFFLTSSSMQSPNTVDKNTSDVNITPVPIEAPTVTPDVISGREPKKYSVKLDIAHGFSPLIINRSDMAMKKSDMIINRADIIEWYSEEDIRPRIYLRSKDGLFNDYIMQYTGRFSYQFNKSGNYTFVLAEFATGKEYPNTTGRVIVT